MEKLKSELIRTNHNFLTLKNATFSVLSYFFLQKSAALRMLHFQPLQNV
jgi:hypothetical protein